MTNIVRIMKNADRGTLVILDELGAGTDPEQGAALGMAILDSLLQKGVLVIVTTHFSELKVFAHNRPRVENASVEFDSETLKPTYKLSIGVPGESNAFAIAGRLGLPAEIIEQAKGFLDPKQRELSDLIRHLKEDQFAASSARAEAEELRREMKELKERVAREERKLRQKQREILSRAHEEARELVRAARREAEQLIRTLREEVKYQESRTGLEHARLIRSEISKLAARIDDKVSSVEMPPEGEIPATLEPGDIVLIPVSTRRGVC